MAKLSSVQQFGENFLAVMQNERKLRQEQEQFRQQMSQSMRQFDLLNSLRQEQLDLDKQRFGLDVEQEARMKEQAVGTLIGQGFRPVQEGFVEGRENIRTNEFETQEPTFDLYDRKFAYPLTEPEKRQELYLGTDIENRQRIDKFGYSPEEITKMNVHNLPESMFDVDKLTTPTKPHLDIADKIRGLEDAENRFRTLTDETKRSEAWDEVRSFSESLISDSQLELERDIIWDDKKFGVPFEESIKNINNFRVSQGKPPLNEQEFDVLRRYRNARFPESYSE